MGMLSICFAFAGPFELPFGVPLPVLEAVTSIGSMDGIFFID
jgi:hypothetical protein